MGSPRIVLCSFLGVVLVLASSACGHATTARTDPPGSILEFAVPPSAGERAKATRYEHDGLALELGPRRSFRISAATLESDPTGYPALGFEIASDQREEFRLWTAAHVGGPLGIFLDGRLVSAPTLQSELPGSGIVDFGAQHRTMSQIHALVDRILAAEARPAR